MTFMMQIANFANSYANFHILGKQSHAQVDGSWLNTTAQKQYWPHHPLGHCIFSYHTQVNKVYGHGLSDLWQEEGSKCSPIWICWIHVNKSLEWRPVWLTKKKDTMFWITSRTSFNKVSKSVVNGLQKKSGRL